MDLPALVSPAGPLLRTLVQKGQDLVESFRKLQVDRNEVVCFKFLILFNTGRCCLPNILFYGFSISITNILCYLVFSLVFSVYCLVTKTLFLISHNLRRVFLLLMGSHCYVSCI